MIEKIDSNQMSISLNDRDFKDSKVKKQTQTLFFQEKVIQSLELVFKNPNVFPHLIVTGMEEVEDFFDVVNFLKSQSSLQYKPRRYYYSPLTNSVLTDMENSSDLVPLFNDKINDIPILYDINPNISSLFGIPTVNTYHPGKLVYANGGFLILPIQKLFQESALADLLFCSLIENNIDFMKMPELLFFEKTNRLISNIPIQPRVILVGDEISLDRLLKKTSLIGKLFKFKINLETEMDLSPKNISKFCSYIDFVSNRLNIKLNLDAKKKMMEIALMQNESRERFSLYLPDIKGILEESVVFAKDAQKEITVNDINATLNNITERYSYPRRKYLDDLKSGLYNLQLKGSRLGRLNALSISDPFGVFYEFGQVNVVSARAIIGSGNFINIEREVNSSGDSHDKGIFVVQSFLKGMLSHLNSFGFDISLLFEQNSSVIDGDSATVAELIVSLSALSGLEIPCNIAITGSMSQYGEALPVGAVSKKIIGWHEVTQLVGDKNVCYKIYLPKSNLKNIILPLDVRERVKKGKFEIFTFTNVNDIVQEVFRVPIGQYVPKSGYSEDSLLGIIEKRLESKKDSQ